MAPLPFLDWPADLFARASTAAPSPAAATRRAGETNRACGCNQRHDRAVSWLEDGDGARQALWFRSIARIKKHMGVGPRMIVS